MRTIIPAEQNPALREIAHEIPVKDIGSAHVQKLIADMKSLMAKEKFGVAIAASQVGEPVALFVVSGKALSLRAEKIEADDESEDAEPEPFPDQVYINPV